MSVYKLPLTLTPKQCETFLCIEKVDLSHDGKKMKAHIDDLPFFPQISVLSIKLLTHEHYVVPRRTWLDSLEQSLEFESCGWKKCVWEGNPNKGG